MELDGLTEFAVDLVSTPEGRLSLAYRNGLLSVTVAGKVRCTKSIASLKDMEVIVDASLAELFVNGGSVVMSVRYYLAGKQRGMPDMETNQLKKNIKLYRLNGVWENYNE